MKKKPTLAVLFGGNSPEYSVSLQSAYAVLTNLDGEKYHILPLGITQTGRWYLYSGAYEHIATDTWAEALDHLTPVAVSPDPAVHGLLALFPHENLLHMDQPLEVPDEERIGRRLEAVTPE